MLAGEQHFGPAAHDARARAAPRADDVGPGPCVPEVQERSVLRFARLKEPLMENEGLSQPKDVSTFDTVGYRDSRWEYL